MTTATAETPSSAKARIRAYLGRAVRKFDLDDDANIFESGIVNSLFALELVTLTEQEFGITVEDEDLDLDNFQSVNALAAFVERKAGFDGSGA